MGLRVYDPRFSTTQHLLNAISALAQLSGLAHLRTANSLQKRGLGFGVGLVFMRLPRGQLTSTQAQHVRIPLTHSPELCGKDRPMQGKKIVTHNRETDSGGQQEVLECLAPDIYGKFLAHRARPPPAADHPSRHLQEESGLHEYFIAHSSLI